MPKTVDIVTRNTVARKLKCVSNEDLNFWFQSFEPALDEFTSVGTIRAFCSDCTPEHKELMQREKRCLW